MARPTHCYPVAVTGRMASGKTFVCRRLHALAQAQGVPLTILDIDRLRARLLESTRRGAARAVQAQLFEHFGREIASASGAVNRRRLSDIAFRDRRELAFVEKTVDPVLISELSRRLQDCRGIVLIDWALIVEKRRLALAEYNVLLVHCSPAAQLQRLAGGDLPLWNCRSRLARQMSHRRRLAQVRRLQAQAGRGNLYELETDATPPPEAFERLWERLHADFQAAREGALSYAG